MLKVSIVTVCFNSIHTIEQCIQSVISQSYASIEFLVIDGGSTDGTLEIIKKYSADIDYFISEFDFGIYDAMNKGINASTGDVVGFLNSDDFYSGSESIALLVENLEKQNVDAVFANLDIVDKVNTGTVIRKYNSKIFNPSLLRFGLMPAHPTFFIKKFFYSKFGLYSTNYNIASDFDMMVRLFYLAKIRYLYIDSSVVIMREGGVSSLSFKNRIKANFEILKICKSHGLYTNFLLILFKLPIKILEYRIT